MGLWILGGGGLWRTPPAGALSHPIVPGPRTAQALAHLGQAKPLVACCLEVAGAPAARPAPVSHTSSTSRWLASVPRAR